MFSWVRQDTPLLFSLQIYELSLNYTYYSDTFWRNWGGKFVKSIGWVIFCCECRNSFVRFGRFRGVSGCENMYMAVAGGCVGMVVIKKKAWQRKMGDNLVCFGKNGDFAEIFLKKIWWNEKIALPLHRN